MTRPFSVPTKIVSGWGALSQLDGLLGALGEGPVAMVGDRGVSRLNLIDELRAFAAPEELIECGWVDPDPTISACEQIAATARRHGCGRVLGVGGGSGLGAAKAVALRLRNERPLDELIGDGLAASPAAPCLAIPTTAGSGSEVSNAFVLTRDRDSSQAIIRGPGYEPRLALLDGRVLSSLPDGPMRHAGIDALSHALEALWANGASPFSDALALAAAELIFDHLGAALRSREEHDLQTMLEASTMANLACGNAGLGLTHALASAPAVTLPHGYQIGVMLPHVAAFNRAAVSPRVAKLIDRIGPFYEELGLRSEFRPGEISSADAAALLSAATDHVFRANNRRASSDEDLRRLLDAAGAR